jgi:hypothetical protein
VKEFSIYTVTLINILIAIRYIWLLIKQRIRPALAMWIFFSIAVTMSLITYLSEGSYSFRDNILNAADLILVVSVSVSIILFGDLSSKFTRFDKACLITVLLIILFWILSQNHLVTNILIQLILVIAYFPVVKRFFDLRENTEPFSVWIGMLLASALALFSAEGMLAYLYTIRAVICISLLLILMIRLEIILRNRGIK